MITLARFILGCSQAILLVGRERKSVSVSAAGKIDAIGKKSLVMFHVTRFRAGCWRSERWHVAAWPFTVTVEEPRIKTLLSKHIRIGSWCIWELL